MVVAGLTGGIASGKSTVGRMLGEAGARLVDADRIAREVVERGRPAWQGIVDHFGRDILDDDENIDRLRLGEIIFHEPAEQAALNAIVHPAVFAEMERQILEIGRDNPRAVVLLDVPLLFETGMDQGLADVIVVYVPEEVQLERLMARNGFSRDDALARIRSQMPIEEKRLRGTCIIDNGGSLEQTRRQVLDVYATLCRQTPRTAR